MVKKTQPTERELELLSLCEAGQVSQLAVLLQSGWHHGKAGAPSAEKILAASTLLAAFRDDQRRLIELTRELAASYSPSARQTACGLLQSLWVQEPDLTGLVLELTADDDWEVREWAAPVFRDKLLADYPAHVPLMQELLAHPHESVKRQIALAVKQTAQKRIPDSAETLLSLLDPLMGEESEYVRKNLGPFAIGDGLLRVWPEETLPFLRRHAASELWPARWNVAMSFSAAQGAKQADAALEMLTELYGDPHKLVYSAVKRAAKNIVKRLDDPRFYTLCQ